MGTKVRLRIGQIANVQGGFAFKSADYTRSGIPLVRIGNVGKGHFVSENFVYLSETFLRKYSSLALTHGDILLGLTGDLGKTCRITKEHLPALLNQRVGRFHVSNSTSPDYLFYLITSHEFQKELGYHFCGGAQANVSPTQIEAIEVVLPQSVEEQSKVAEVLNAVDRAIDQTYALIAKYQRIKTGLMQDLLTRGINEHGQPRDQAKHKFRPSPLGLIPESWNIEPIAKLFKMELGKMLNKSAKCGKYPKPYLGNKNVQWDWIDISDLETMDFSPKEQRHFRLKKDDILICEGGEVGRAALWKDELTECYFQKAIHRLTPRDQRIIPEFMIYYMRFVTSNGLLLNLTSQTSIAHLTQEKLAELPVCFPKPDEMRQIITLLGTQTSLIETEQAQLVKFHKLKTGLMQNLLTGNVSVEPLLNFKRGGNA